MTKTIMITGSSSGIGKTTAKLFQERGWNVVATMRSPNNETELTELDNVLVTRLDVADKGSIKAAVDAGLERFGQLDVLMNNAGFAVYGPLEAIPSEAIREQFETNVFGLLETTKAVLPHFRARREGMILNISSIGGVLAFPLGTLYHGSKWAVEGLSEALSFELREIGVTLKIIEPGDTLTDIRIDAVNDESMTEYQHLVRTLPASYAPIKAQGSEPVVIAEAIFRAATDGKDQLRYPAGDDAITKVANRKAMDEQAFLQDMREQFQIRPEPTD